MAYDPNVIISAYDSKAHIEDQVEKSGSLRVVLPRAFILKYLQRDDVVLDAGGGTGINAILMARRCRRVTLLDISPRVLRLAQQNISASRVLGKIELLQGDITDLGCFADGTFSLVVCVGDAISYVLDRRAQAIAELVRVARSGAMVIVGCDSKLGFMRMKLAEGRLDEALAIYRSGECDCGMGPRTHLYTVDEMRSLLERHGCRVLEIASTPTMADTVHASLYQDATHLKQLAVLEQELCARPELLGMGLHLLFVAQKKARGAREGRNRSTEHVASIVAAPP